MNKLFILVTISFLIIGNEAMFGRNKKPKTQRREVTVGDEIFGTIGGAASSQSNVVYEPKASEDVIYGTVTAHKPATRSKDGKRPSTPSLPEETVYSTLAEMRPSASGSSPRLPATRSTNGRRPPAPAPPSDDEDDFEDAGKVMDQVRRDRGMQTRSQSEADPIYAQVNKREEPDFVDVAAIMRERQHGMQTRSQSRAEPIYSQVQKTEPIYGQVNKPKSDF